MTELFEEILNILRSAVLLAIGIVKPLVDSGIPVENRLILAAAIFLVLWPIFAAAVGAHRRSRIRRLAQNADTYDPKTFLEMRKSKLLGDDFQGIYILRNESKKKYYVGQSVHVLARVNQHFTGHGNGDVYADYRNGARFSIRTLRLKGSGFKTLNSLERYAIAAYRAYTKGYNKTRGNKG